MIGTFLFYYQKKKNTKNLYGLFCRENNLIRGKWTRFAIMYILHVEKIRQEEYPICTINGINWSKVNVLIYVFVTRFFFLNNYLSVTRPLFFSRDRRWDIQKVWRMKVIKGFVRDNNLSRHFFSKVNCF